MMSCNPFRRLLRSCRLFLHLGKIMSALSELQDAAAANTKAIADLSARIDALPTGVDGGEVQKVTDAIKVNNAALDQLAVPAA